MNEVPLIACLFKWDKKKAEWVHDRTILGDEDDHWRADVDPHSWCNKQEGEDSDWEPIPGRLATIWTLISGIRLQWFSPPSPCEWISADVFDLLEDAKPKLPFRSFTGGISVFVKAREEVKRVLLEAMKK